MRRSAARAPECRTNLNALLLIGSILWFGYRGDRMDTQQGSKPGTDVLPRQPRVEAATYPDIVLIGQRRFSTSNTTALI